MHNATLAWKIKTSRHYLRLGSFRIRCHEQQVFCWRCTCDTSRSYLAAEPCSLCMAWLFPLRQSPGAQQSSPGFITARLPHMDTPSRRPHGCLRSVTTLDSSGQDEQESTRSSEQKQGFPVFFGVSLPDHMCTKEKYSYTIHLALLCYVFAFHPLANISIFYLHLPMHIPIPSIESYLFSSYCPATHFFWLPVPSSPSKLDQHHSQLHLLSSATQAHTISFYNLPGPDRVSPGYCSLHWKVRSTSCKKVSYSCPAAYSASLIFPLQIQEKREVIWFSSVAHCLRLRSSRKEEGSLLHLSPSPFKSPCPLQLHHAHIILI